MPEDIAFIDGQRAFRGGASLDEVPDLLDERMMDGKLFAARFIDGWRIEFYRSTSEVCRAA